jgi:hypothetical protein
MKGGPRRLLGPVVFPGCNGLQALGPEVGGEAVGAKIELADFVVVGGNAGVRRKLLKRDRGELRIDVFNVRAEDVADRRIPVQLSFLDHHAAEGRRHRFGVGSEMETVVDCGPARRFARRPPPPGSTPSRASSPSCDGGIELRDA